MSQFIPISRGQRQFVSAPTGEIKIPAFPGVPSPPRKPSMLILLAPTGAMFLLSMAVSFLTGSSGMGTFLLISGPAMSLVAFLRYRQQKQEVEDETKRVLTAYNNRLKQVLDLAKSFHDQQMAALIWRYPPPGSFLPWVTERHHRIWEHRPGQPDFLDLRLGIGRRAPSYTLRLPPVDIPELAPQPLLEAHQEAAPYQRLEAAPVGWALERHNSLAVVGELALRQSLARALLAQITALHAPEDLQLWAFFPPSQVDRWEWLKWLPHTAAIRGRSDFRQLAFQADDLQRACSALMDELEARRLRIDAGRPLESPTLVLLVTEPALIAGEPLLERLVQQEDLNIKLILLAPNASSLPNGLAGWVDIHGREQAVLHHGSDGSPSTFVPDQLEWKTAEQMARAMAPLRLADDANGEPLPDEIQLLDLTDVPSLEEMDLSQRWQEALTRPPQLKTPLGMRTGNRPLVIDLKQNGHGPHGLIAGTTGSGKSELLLT
ncbi:MAG: FtsK/SpoIIIE domain-containing protein, partial [Anaerolineales bacterium]